MLLVATSVAAVRAQESDAGGGYRTVSDVSYRTEADATDYIKERCRLDVYYPAGKQKYSTVVWFHGGGLTGGNRSVPRGLREQGIAVVAVNYRLSPQVRVEDCLADAAAAVAWTFANIEQYGGSVDRIFVSGHSAGGYLTSMIGLDRNWLAKHQIDANRIAGLIPYSGHTITHFTARKELGMKDTQPLINELAPLYFVRPDAPPILLITGDRELEMLGRYEENAYFWRMLKVAGHPDVTLYELDGYNHGQMADPAHPLLLRFLKRVEQGHP
ncbi:MAG: alpha/beta hydrolase [Planctomycetaceae bacterium]|nr:alpha/beta hydrolase [Planctomycetaceae bacterium]